MICKCGKKLDDDVRVCPNCGEEVNNTTSFINNIDKDKVMEKAVSIGNVIKETTNEMKDDINKSIATASGSKGMDAQKKFWSSLGIKTKIAIGVVAVIIVIVFLNVGGNSKYEIQDASTRLSNDSTMHMVAQGADHTYKNMSFDVIASDSDECIVLASFKYMGKQKYKVYHYRDGKYIEDASVDSKSEAKKYKNKWLK